MERCENLPHIQKGLCVGDKECVMSEDVRNSHEESDYFVLGKIPLRLHSGIGYTQQSKA